MIKKKNDNTSDMQNSDPKSDGVELDPAHELIQTNQALTEDLQRVQAEFVNFKRRTDEEKPRQVAAGKAATVIKLIPVIDNIERALAHVPDDIAKHPYFSGLAGVHKQLVESLKELAIVKIETVGKPFSPETMNAVSTAESDGPSDTVIEELQSGYMLDGLVVREAMVKVSA